MGRGVGSGDRTRRGGAGVHRRAVRSPGRRPGRAAGPAVAGTRPPSAGLGTPRGAVGPARAQLGRAHGQRRLPRPPARPGPYLGHPHRGRDEPGRAQLRAVEVRRGPRRRGRLGPRARPRHHPGTAALAARAGRWGLEQREGHPPQVGRHRQRDGRVAGVEVELHRKKPDRYDGIVRDVDPDFDEVWWFCPAGDVAWLLGVLHGLPHLPSRPVHRVRALPEELGR